MKTSGVSTKAGTPFYIAPEVFTSANYFNSADIWSLGITFLELLLGDRIYNFIQGIRAPAERQDFPSKELLDKIEKNQIKILVQLMLSKNPNKRPTAQQIKQVLEGKSLQKIIPDPIIIKTDNYQNPKTIELIADYDCSFIWASNGNQYGSNTKDITASFGNTNQLGMPYNGKCGWKGGAYMMIAIHKLLSQKIKILTGTYNNPLQIPIPEGFDANQCHFFWLSQGNQYGDQTGEVVFGFGDSRKAGIPYDGKCGWKSGVWMVIAYKSDAPIKVLTGTHQFPLNAPIPEGSIESKFFWGSQQNHYSATTGDVVPLYGVTRQVRMPYNGNRFWKGGSWISIGIL